MTTLTIALTEGFADWEAAMLAATARSWYGVDVRHATLDGGGVRSAGGMQVTPDDTLDQALNGADAIAVIGGRIWRTDAAPDLTVRLQSFHAAGKIVGGICDGTRALARAGLLDRIHHTSNDADTLDVPGYAGAAHFAAAGRAVRDGTIVTASGLQPVSFMAEMLRAMGIGDQNLQDYEGLLAQEHQRPAVSLG